MTKASDNLFPKVLITEGSAPSSPAAGNQAAFIDTADHHLKLKNSSGTVTDLQAASGGGTVTTVKDEGSNLSTAVVSLDFVGAGVTATGTTAVTVTIPGGGVTQAFAGYNTIGGSTETPGVNSKVYAKQITLANDCLITDIEAYLNSASGTSGGPACALYTDSAGSPAQLLGFSVPQLMSYVGGARWIGGAIGKWVVAGTYWIAVRLADTGGAVLPTIAYDGSGSDMTATGLAGTAEDWSIYTSSTTTARKFSIRANTIR